MRTALILLPATLIAAPACAQPQAPDVAQVQRQLTDPALTDKLTDVMHALSNAFLNLPVGEVQAAIEGRPVTPADRGRTVRTETHLNQQQLDRQIADSRVAMQAGMRAMAAALPGMVKGLTDAQHELERAPTNMPSPNYPKQ